MKNEIGVIARLRPAGDSLRCVREFGLTTCQLSCWDTSLFTARNAEEVREQISGTGVGVTSLWAGWPGPAVWDFVEGPGTLGLVPEQYRDRGVFAWGCPPLESIPAWVIMDRVMMDRPLWKRDYPTEIAVFREYQEEMRAKWASESATKNKAEKTEP